MLVLAVLLCHMVVVLCCQQEATKRAHEAFNDVMDAPLPAQVQDQVRPSCVQFA